ncbi:MAG TPA: hypothetical protein VFS44_05290 [Gemmatimonadaceae bacterium]|nr:hypothetical protein [Gemmatimonadaceae bacterium]
MRLRSITLLLCILAVAACADQRTPTAPRASAPSAIISDGASGGNPDFFFLPPMVPNPVGSPDFEPGAFNGRLAPVVEICELATLSDDCSGPAFYTFPRSEVRVVPSGEHYMVNWKTDVKRLDPTKYYRVRVLVGGRLLGFADVDPVSSGSELRNARTGEVIPLLPGSTLPIKFRIERSALCDNRSDCGSATFTNEGGTLVTNTKYAGVELPPDALPPGVTELTLTIERVNTAGRSCLDVDQIEMYSPLLEFDGCYKITSDPAMYGSSSLLQPATVGICVALAETDPKYDFLQLHRSNEFEAVIEALPSAPATFLDCAGFSASVATTASAARGGWPGLAMSRLRAAGSAVASLLAPRPLYAVDLGLGGKTTKLSNFGWALPDTIAPVGSTTLTSDGTTPIVPSVQLLGTQVHDGTPFGTPVPTIPVTFTVYDYYYNVVASATVQTDAQGVASASFSSLSQGSYTIYADAPAYGNVTFTADVGVVIIP